MSKVLLLTIAVLACPAIWITIIVPLIGRSIGLPFKIGSLPLDRRDERLGKRSSFWLAGVLGWGIGISMLGVSTAIFIEGTRLTSLNLFCAVIFCCFVPASLTDGDWTYPLSKMRLPDGAREPANLD